MAECSYLWCRPFLPTNRTAPQGEPLDHSMTADKVEVLRSIVVKLVWLDGDLGDGLLDYDPIDC